MAIIDTPPWWISACIHIQFHARVTIREWPAAVDDVDAAVQLAAATARYCPAWQYARRTYARITQPHLCIVCTCRVRG